MATETQTKLVGFCLGDKTNYNATSYANHIWFDPTNKQILLNGIEYIPKKLSELVNDKNFITSITKSMVENVLTGNITSHTHSYLPLSGGTMTGVLTINTYYDSSLILDEPSGEKYHMISFRASGEEYAYLRSNYLGSENILQFNGSNILHAGNYHSYALPLSGGTMSNTNLVTNLNADLLDGYHASSFYTLKPIRSDQNSIYDLRYNYGTYDKGDYNGTYKDEYPTGYGSYLSLAYNDKNIGALMFFDASKINKLGHIYVKTRTAGDSSTTYSEWGTLAYLTDNVASASKWANARTITLTGSVTGSVSIDGSANVSLATTTNHTHSEYLPLTGGTLSGNLTCNGDYIDMNNDSGSRGYRGFFNQSGSANRASGSHIFMYGGGQALGTNSVSIGYQAYAGIRNEDADKTTYPYIAWQWMPTEKFMVDTTNSATLSGGEYYGFPLLPNEMVRWNIGGQNVIYENSSSYKELLVVIKASDADTGLVFGGKTTLPYRASKTLIAGKYIVGDGEYLKNITEITINDVKYYQVIIYTWNTTAFPTSYDFTQQVKVMCATKVSNSNYSGASSYASGYYSVASGTYSVASGAYSVASGFYSVASGYSSVASSEYSVASGYSSVASGYYSVASGYSSVASGAYSVASGFSSVASGTSSVASGYYSVARGYSSVASGTYSVASGSYSVASGAYSVASGNFSVASGYASVASHDHCTVLARNGETMSNDQTIVGKFNAKVAGLFIIGNGTSDTARSNAFVVDESGNVTAKYFSGYANAIGGEGIKVYASNANEINFGGTSSADTIYFGYRSMDSRPTPTTYNFGKGNATIQAATFSGNAATATNADTLDGYHASNLVKFYLSPMSSGAPADSAKSWFIDTMPAGTGAVVYNVPGSEKTIIAGKSTGAYGHMLQLNYNDNYLRMLRYKGGSWLSTDWEKISAGYADTATALTSSAGSATQPIYFSNGKPVACSYTLGKSVPSNAVFTDTTYSVATASADGLMSAAMFKAQMVKSVGVKQGAEMMKPDGTITITDHSVYITQDKSNINGVYQQDVVDGGGVKIPNATKDYDGSMSYTDKRKISHVSDNGYCTVASVFTMNVNANYSNLDALNGVEFSASDFAGLTDVLGDSRESVQPEFIRLKLLSTGVVYGYTLYESDNYLDVYKYVCYPHNSEIVYDGGLVYIEPIS